MVNNILKDMILNEMVEGEEDQIVRELKNEPSFNEEFIRRRYRELKYNAKRGN